ncbi:hypothetical protein Dimus_005582 [Dionaea muscipula]
MRVSLAFAVGSEVLEIHWAVPIVAVGSSCGSKLPLFNGLVGVGDGGSVSEEVRVTPATREALRSLPTDGLQQPPSSPVGPRLGAAGLASSGDHRRWGRLTQPRRHRSLVEEYRRHLHVVHPRLMWSFDSARNRDLRVRSVVERSMIKGLGSVEEELRSDMTEFAVVVPPSEGLAPIGTIDLDLQSSSEDF